MPIQRHKGAGAPRRHEAAVYFVAESVAQRERWRRAAKKQRMPLGAWLITAAETFLSGVSAR